jgi:hypothetical protein
LIESRDGLILVDTGLGVEDIADPKRLGFAFIAAARPRLEVSETGCGKSLTSASDPPTYATS